MGDSTNGWDDTRLPERQRERPDALVPPSGPHTEPHDEFAEELERQAREAVRVVRESVGEFGARVRQVLDLASGTWEETSIGAPTEQSTAPQPDDSRARALAKRWVAKDFLVDPELPDGMAVHGVHDTSVWKLSLRERGETRTRGEGSEPYRGTTPPPLGPVLPVWEYDFPASPDIEAGERRERLPRTEVLGACLKCNGTGHRACSGCDGKGFVQCPACHGRARITCARCRGRGRVADPASERRARASKSYLQVRAERLAVDAGDKLADFAERLRQDYGVPLPPSGQWAPLAPASGETIPCPDCVNGTIPCACGNGKLVCERCHGTSAQPCTVCGGSGRVLRFQEVVRRFDTRITERTLPADAPSANAWVTDEMVKRAAGEVVWEGPLDTVADAQPPSGVPVAVWDAARAFERGNGHALTTSAEAASSPDEGARHVISRRLRLTRLPLTRVDYAFTGNAYTFVAVGRGGAERFWAQTFPPRWGRVSRFFRALARDLAGDQQPSRPSITGARNGTLKSLEEFRARREQSTQHDTVDLPRDDDGGE